FHFFRLIRRNLSNRPFRNIATIVAFAFIAATLFSSPYLVHGAQESLDDGMSRMGADILVVPDEYEAAGQTIILNGQPSSFFFDQANLEKISRIPGVAKASPQIYIATLFASCCAAPVQMIAIDPENDFTVSSWLRGNNGVKLGKDEIIIGGAVIQDVGNDLMFYGHTFHVVGILKQTGMGIDNTVFTRFEDARVMAAESELKAVRSVSIPPGKISAVLVKVDPGSSPATVASAIQETVPGTKSITPNALLGTVNSQLGAVRRLLTGTNLAIMVISIPLLGLISAMVVHERRKEIAILRGIGATKKFVTQLIFAESLTLAITGGLLGIFSALAILVGFSDFVAFSLKIPLTMPSPAVLLAEAGMALLMCAVIGGIASFYQAILINRSDPYETIRKGES
ncbi:MAG TPA: FtsX-like permease family protein, partial [Methanoregula sp.]|nr:FtsX-like permease family protein [Methanoregula sp.]